MGLTRSDKTEITELIKETFAALAKELVTKISEDVTKKFEEKVTDTFANYDSKISLLEKDNAALHAKIDSLEQYTRRNSIRIFGVHEESNENTLNVVKSIFSDTLKAVDTLKAPDTLTWIDRCHRIRNKNQLATSNRPAAIIVKFRIHLPG
ncbi:hypothetical protein QE152_g16983 [Popillia japonica]|uniref:Uncharacterized protein n=1 Tax=Popillia japonica TaxID=7064 RepID=A0AAW1L5G8_POPJA